METLKVITICNPETENLKESFIARLIQSDGVNVAFWIDESDKHNPGDLINFAASNTCTLELEEFFPNRIIVPIEHVRTIDTIKND